MDFLEHSSANEFGRYAFVPPDLPLAMMGKTTLVAITTAPAIALPSANTSHAAGDSIHGGHEIYVELMCVRQINTTIL